ncbi:unnamed protein product [Protopolystoma xenopodis]|uniref:Uncharacterized protein n=1 Tax=Protopolystoma xenopodis TaxID=117903 RepID=A0A3S5A8B0_9PLAT|nr:unnamed protein product [Protopolystoma xenopodis]
MPLLSRPLRPQQLPQLQSPISGLTNICGHTSSLSTARIATSVASTSSASIHGGQLFTGLPMRGAPSSSSLLLLRNSAGLQSHSAPAGQPILRSGANEGGSYSGISAWPLVPSSLDRNADADGGVNALATYILPDQSCAPASEITESATTSSVCLTDRQMAALMLGLTSGRQASWFHDVEAEGDGDADSPVGHVDTEDYETTSRRVEDFLSSECHFDVSSPPSNRQLQQTMDSVSATTDSGVSEEEDALFLGLMQGLLMHGQETDTHTFKVKSPSICLPSRVSPFHRAHPHQAQHFQQTQIQRQSPFMLLNRNIPHGQTTLSPTNYLGQKAPQNHLQPHQPLGGRILNHTPATSITPSQSGLNPWQSGISIFGSNISVTASGTPITSEVNIESSTSPVQHQSDLFSHRASGLFDELSWLGGPLASLSSSGLFGPEPGDDVDVEVDTDAEADADVDEELSSELHSASIRHTANTGSTVNSLFPCLSSQSSTSPASISGQPRIGHFSTVNTGLALSGLIGSSTTGATSGVGGILPATGLSGVSSASSSGLSGICASPVCSPGLGMTVTSPMSIPGRSGNSTCELGSPSAIRHYNPHQMRSGALPRQQQLILQQQQSQSHSPNILAQQIPALLSSSPAAGMNPVLSPRSFLYTPKSLPRSSTTNTSGECAPLRDPSISIYPSCLAPGGPTSTSPSLASPPLTVVGSLGASPGGGSSRPTGLGLAPGSGRLLFQVIRFYDHIFTYRMKI